MSVIRYTLGGDYDQNRSALAKYDLYKPDDPNKSYLVGSNFDADRETVYDGGNLASQLYYGDFTYLDPHRTGFLFDFSDNVASVDITGGVFGDILRGGSGNDTLNGSDGNDVLEGGFGTNTITGGTGVNTLSYEHSSVAVTVVGGLNVAVDSATGGTTINDTFSDIQIYRGSAYADTFFGNSSNDIFEGGAGADTINSLGGAASYQHSGAAVTVNLTTGVNTGGDAQDDQLTGIAKVYGSAFADTLTGDDSANTLSGMGGADTIRGNGGADRIAVTVTPTLVDGGDGIDTLLIQGGGHANLNDSNFHGIERIGVGNGGSVDLSGVSTAATAIISTSTAGNGVSIVGSQGADRIFAGKGTDFIQGGAGNDRIVGGSGRDTFDFSQSGFGRDQVFGADLDRDTFNVNGLGQALHFAAAGTNGQDTLVYGDSHTSDAFVLKGIGVDDVRAAAAGPDSPFHYSNPA